MENEAQLTPDRKMEKLRISDKESSWTLLVSPQVAEEYRKTNTTVMTLSQKLDLVVEITEDLNLGKSENSVSESEKLNVNSTFDDKPIIREAFTHKAAQDMVTNKEPKKEKLTISDGEMSMYLGVSPRVKEEFIRQKTSGMDVVDQMDLITQIAKELKPGNNQNSECETDKLGESSVQDEKQEVKAEFSIKYQKRLGSGVIDSFLDIAERLFEDGYVTFPEYISQMFNESGNLGESILPYLKAIYELARASLDFEGMTDAIVVAKFDIDNFLLENSQSRSNTNFTKVAAVNKSLSDEVVVLRLINHPWALIALWKLAEYLPSLLLDMAKDEPPEKLLTGIEKKVQFALNRQATALEDGWCPDSAEEEAVSLLDPNCCPEEPEEIEITQSQMDKIYERLVELSEIR